MTDEVGPLDIPIDESPDMNEGAPIPEAEFDEDSDVLNAHDSGRFVEDIDDSTLALFEGDAGGLLLAQRRALVALLKNRFISAAQNPAEWRIIRDDPAPFKARLNDMFLDLHLDLYSEVAFKRQAASEGSGREFPSLLHDVAYSREETIALVFLRHRFQSEQASGREDVTIERDDVLAHVASFRPASSTNRSSDESKANNAIDNLIKAKVLVKTNDSARLRVSPVIATLLPLARLHQLWEWLAEQNNSDPRSVSGSEELIVEGELPE